MKGRKPIPTALKLMRGNPGRGPINTDEPQPPALDDTAAPDELKDPRARAEWDRIAPGLIACGQVTSADRTLLMAYCLKYAQWLKLEDQAAHIPAAIAQKHRAIRLANKTLEVMLRASAELGITPASRTRVTRIAKPAVSKWAGALP